MTLRILEEVDEYRIAINQDPVESNDSDPKTDCEDRYLRSQTCDCNCGECWNFADSEWGIE